jgi:hypothetical protein
MKNNFNKPTINQRKFMQGNDIVIVAIQESFDKLDNNRCNVNLIMGINGKTVLDCNILRTSDITFYPQKFTMYYNPVMLYSSSELLQIVKLMNNGVLNRLQLKELANIVLLDKIELD